MTMLSLTANIKVLIKRVSDWLQALKTTVKGKIYQIVSHVLPDDLPEDEMPDPLSLYTECPGQVARSPIRHIPN